jgi:hypothetical protein
MTHSPDRSRRDFVSQGIGVGFALAVLPAAAWAITRPVVVEPVSTVASRSNCWNPAICARTS